MAVVHCREVTNRDGTRDMKQDKRYVRVFQILTDTPTDGAKVVRDFAGGAGMETPPAYGARWEQVGAGGVVTDFDEDARCIEKHAAQNDDENHQNWTLTCRFAGIGDPVAEPPRVHWTGEKYQETTQKDAAGVLVVNSAGDPYESGLTRDRHRRVLIIERNVLTWDPRTKDTFIDTLNQLTFLAARHPPGFLPGTCKIDELDAEPVYYPDYPVRTAIHYWREHIKISIDPRGWVASLLDHGHQVYVRDNLGNIVLNPDGTRKKRRIREGGTHLGTAQPLDGNGNLLPHGNPAVFNSFTKYLPADWTALNITY